MPIKTSDAPMSAERLHEINRFWHQNGEPGLDWSATLALAQKHVQELLGEIERVREAVRCEMCGTFCCPACSYCHGCKGYLCPSCNDDETHVCPRRALGPKPDAIRKAVKP